MFMPNLISSVVITFAPKNPLDAYSTIVLSLDSNAGSTLSQAIEYGKSPLTVRFVNKSLD
jgi:hypothetical protein